MVAMVFMIRNSALMVYGEVLRPLFVVPGAIITRIFDVPLCRTHQGL
jgi:hypothetical protein